MKHTPGPWSSDSRDYVSVPLKAIDCERIGFSVCFVHGHREEEAAANARLIAAAPDLLEALQDALQYLQRLLPDEALSPHRVAIAKATGEPL